MDIIRYFYDKFSSVLEELKSRELLAYDSLEGMIFGVPSGDHDADLYTNAAFIVGKANARPVLEIAELLRDKFVCMVDEVESAVVAGSGFINFILDFDVYCKLLAAIADLGDGYGDSSFGAGVSLNIEFVSANPTGPLHIGHARGAVLGDTLAKLLRKVGYSVTAEYYINDFGLQIDKLVRSVFYRYRELIDDEVAPISGELSYPGEYLIDAARLLLDKHGADLSLENGKDYDEIRCFAVDRMMHIIRQDLESLGVKHDSFVSEMDLVRDGVVDRAVALIDDAGYVYKGYPEPPKDDAHAEGWVSRENLLFRSTAFGDTLDRSLKKADGEWTYFATDIGYHYFKLQRGFNLLLIGLGYDHLGYVDRISGVVEALSGVKGKVIVKMHNLVTFYDSGVQVKMSKRSGTFLSISDVLAEVGLDGLRFMMLSRRGESPIDFDFARFRDRSRENPVFYLQYTNVRTKSVIRNVLGFIRDFEAIRGADGHLLVTEYERLILRSLSSWPSVLESAASCYEPHRIVKYLLELAELFNSLWGQGNRDSGYRFVVPEDQKLMTARALLVYSVSVVMSSGLKLMGIEPLEHM